MDEAFYQVSEPNSQVFGESQKGPVSGAVPPRNIRPNQIQNTVKHQYPRHGTGVFLPRVQSKPKPTSKNMIPKPQQNVHLNQQNLFVSFDNKFDRVSSAELDRYALDVNPKFLEILTEYRQRKQR